PRTHVRRLLQRLRSPARPPAARRIHLPPESPVPPSHRIQAESAQRVMLLSPGVPPATHVAHLARLPPADVRLRFATGSVLTYAAHSLLTALPVEAAHPHA